MEIKTPKTGNTARGRLKNHTGDPVSRAATGITSKFRAIGNSRGVILNNTLLNASGLIPDADIVIHAGKGMITIVQAKPAPANNELSAWDSLFKACIKKGAKPEPDLFEGMKNVYDANEW